MMDTPASSAVPDDESVAPAPPHEKPAIPASSAARGNGWDTIDIPPVGGPASKGWREGTLTRAEELEALSRFWVRPRGPQNFWVRPRGPQNNDEVLTKAICRHLHAARQAALGAPPDPPRRFRFRIFRHGRYGPCIERARSNLDAAEAHLLTLAPNTYILGQMPCLLKHVQCHLPPTDARRQEFERIAQKLGITDPNHLLLHEGKDSSSVDKDAIVTAERRKIVSIVRGASSAALREHIRLGSFRNVVVSTAALMLLLAIGVAITGFFRPTLIPMCFAPQEAGVVTVVCPTHQSQPFIPTGQPGQVGVQVADIDDVVQATAKPPDLLVVELVGLTAAAIATAAASAVSRARPSGTACPFLSPPSSSRLARSPPSSACCSCVANSFPASVHWIRPRKSLPGR